MNNNKTLSSFYLTLTSSYLTLTSISLTLSSIRLFLSSISLFLSSISFTLSSICLTLSSSYLTLSSIHFFLLLLHFFLKFKKVLLDGSVCVRDGGGIPSFFSLDKAESPPAFSAGTPWLQFKIINIGIQILVAPAGEIDDDDVGFIELLLIQNGQSVCWFDGRNDAFGLA